jgi:hypothetical protein
MLGWSRTFDTHMLHLNFCRQMTHLLALPCQLVMSAACVLFLYYSPVLSYTSVYHMQQINASGILTNVQLNTFQIVAAFSGLV